MTSRIAVLALAGTLASCATVSQVEKRIDTAGEAADALRQSVTANAANGGVQRTKRPRLAGEELVVNASTLPARFNERISYVTRGSQTLAQTLEDLSSVVGVVIRSVENSNPAADMTRPGEPVSGAVTIDYHGSIRGLLDEIARKGDVTWRYSATTKTVEFFRFETRAISVNVPAGAKTIASSVSLAGVTGGGGGGSGSGAGAGNVSVTQNLSIDPWGSIMEGVRSILTDGKVAGPAGGAGGAAGMPPGPPGAGGLRATFISGAIEGSAIANPELGLITVTGKPHVLERVARYVDSINARFSRNILIDVKILNVTLNDQASAGFNVSLLYSRLGKLGAAVSGPAALTAGLASPGVFTIGPNDPDSPWDGSALIAKALSQYGKVSLQRQGQVLAVNGQPSPLQVANEISYVSASNTVMSPNVGASVTQTVSQKVVGFTANFTPLVLGDNRILLSYQMQISALASPLTANEQGIVTPNIASQSLPGQAFVRDGQAIVLFGFDEQRDGADGAVHLAGASKAATRERQMMVVVVQVNTGVKDESK